MRSRAFTTFLIGAWLAFGMAVYFAGVVNSRNVENMVHDPQPAEALRMQKLGVRDTAMLLRFESDQANRFLEEVWTNCQFAIGLLFFFYLLFGTGESKFILGAALALVVVVGVERFFVIPEMTGLGRLLDFIPDSDPTPVRGRYHVMQNTYLGVEIVKWVMQAALAGYFMTRSRRRSRNAGNQLNVIDKADYGHVDR